MASKPKKAKIMATETPVDNSASGAAINLDLLAKIVTATKASGAMYVKAEDSAGLVLLGLVECNPAMTDSEGAIATRATNAGINYVDMNTETAAVTQTAPIVAAEVVKPTFNVRTDVGLPAIKRGGGRGRASSLPIDSLAAPVKDEAGNIVYASFHVPATADKPEPAKGLAPTISNANAKYSKGTGVFDTVNVAVYQTGEDGKRVKVDGKFVKVGEKAVQREQRIAEREFAVRSVGASDPNGAGARVFRIL